MSILQLLQYYYAEAPIDGNSFLTSDRCHSMLVCKYVQKGLAEPPQYYAVV